MPWVGREVIDRLVDELKSTSMDLARQIKLAESLNSRNLVLYDKLGELTVTNRRLEKRIDDLTLRYTNLVEQVTQSAIGDDEARETLRQLGLGECEPCGSS